MSDSRSSTPTPEASGDEAQQFVKCGICGAGMTVEHAAAHIQNHRDSGWDGTE